MFHTQIESHKSIVQHISKNDDDDDVDLESSPKNPWQSWTKAQRITDERDFQSADKPQSANWGRY